MLACLDRGSRTLLAVQAANRFGVSVLHAGQEEIARAFATKAPVAEKWAGVDWSERDGVPAIDGALVWVACDLRDVIAGGDHVIVTGEVVAWRRRGRPAGLPRRRRTGRWAERRAWRRERTIDATLATRSRRASRSRAGSRRTSSTRWSPAADPDRASASPARRVLEVQGAQERRVAADPGQPARSSTATAIWSRRAATPSGCATCGSAAAAAWCSAAGPRSSLRPSSPTRRSPPLAARLPEEVEMGGRRLLRRRRRPTSSDEELRRIAPDHPALPHRIAALSLRSALRWCRFGGAQGEEEDHAAADGHDPHLAADDRQGDRLLGCRRAAPRSRCRRSRARRRRRGPPRRGRRRAAAGCRRGSGGRRRPRGR